MKSIVIIPLLVVLVSACVNTQNEQKFDYTSDKNPEAFNITQINEEGIISATDENMGCMTPGINLFSYLGKDSGVECISLGPVKYSITGPQICGGVKAIVFEKLIQENPSCGNWYHVRIENGTEGWLSQNFFRKSICSTNQDCQKMHCVTPAGGGSCYPANQNFNSCENGLCA